MALWALGWLWWRAWTGLVAGDAAALCVAGVALGDIHLRFTWQAWHLVTSTFFSRGHLGHWAGSGGPLGLDWSPVTPRHFGLAGVALGDIHLRFAWQAWHLVTSTFVSRWHLGHWAGSGGALGLDWSPVMWRLVTSTFIFAWQAWRLGHRALGWLWWCAWTGLVAGDAAAL